jgi:hypothetical protein
MGPHLGPPPGLPARPSLLAPTSCRARSRHHPEFDYDSLATAEEIGYRGQDVLRWLAALAESDIPRAVDIHLIFDIHRRWFESTFPNDAGHPRTSMVLNRKGTAVEVPAIIPALVNACDNWSYRREHRSHDSDDELIELIVDEANTLTVDVYDATRSSTATPARPGTCATTC